MRNRIARNSKSRTNRAIPRQSSPIVVTLEPACHAEGAGSSPVAAWTRPRGGAPNVRRRGLALVELLEPLSAKSVLIVGVGGGVGSFAFAADAGARVIANARRRCRAHARLGRDGKRRPPRSRCRAQYNWHTGLHRCPHRPGKQREALPRTPRSCDQAAPPSRPNRSSI
jgi:hypothetical protein